MPIKPEIAKMRRRVLALLAQPRWRNQTTNAIAHAARVSWKFVDKIRAEMSSAAPGKPRQGRDGNLYPTHKPRNQRRVE